ncbi:domain of Kin17 curved DNA-binding protein-domain-containing protein [Halteromyces radiatus]|uniref:domain of Kin17 curved DNA-binding protein-domain-containing protein n=1 Tax=Halteromyces radiatus TaxID=101107 RepID=UPI00221F9DBA|nr:domain of Kin17 curved DNA-binding protein-domain-containing protein [Halteromyces radiatus]KAI8084750.1 domain of Kin17 curved DNA-binding protein-domain-containing protein [Halteromyces radiatus]
MGISGGMTPKALANRMKAKGLLKLVYYCQACQKQCRDANGFKCHTQSESHQRQMLLVADNPGKYIVNYSDQFKKDFLSILSRRHGTKRVFANAVYQEYIADRHHIHMNSTRWDSLTGFVKYLGREGICHVDETERGYWITWIDNSPKALARQAAIQKMERQAKDDEEREQELLKDQIERASKLAEERGDSEQHTVTELKRDQDQGKIKLNMSLKPNIPSTTTTTTTQTTSASPSLTMKKPTGNKMKLMMGGMKKQESSTTPTTGATAKKPMMMMNLGKRKSSPDNNTDASLSMDKKIKSS